MDGRRVRHLASGALVAGSLVSGGTVGNVLLLGSAEHRGDPVGRLSANLGSQPPAPTARGDGAVATRLVLTARGSRATVLKPPRVTVARTSGTPSPQPVVIAAPPATKAVVVTKSVPRTQPTTSKGARATTNPVVTTRPTVAKGSGDHVGRSAVTEPVETHVEHVEDHSREIEREHLFDD